MTKPLNRPINVKISDITSISANISWIKPSNTDNIKTIVFISEYNTSIYYPIDGKTYSPNPKYSYGDILDNNISCTQSNVISGTSGYHCIYNDTDNSATVFGLKPEKEYTILAYSHIDNDYLSCDTAKYNFQTKYTQTLQDIRISVLDIITRKPIKDVTVTLKNTYNNTIYIGTTDYTGLCITDEIEEGRYNIVLTHPEYNELIKHSFFNRIHISDMNDKSYQYSNTMGRTPYQTKGMNYIQRKADITLYMFK